MINKEELKNEAIKARELSYSPYSHFKVGAALLTKDGKYIYGANIENSAYGLCLCAERNAIFGAYMQGYKKEDIIALGLVTDSPKLASPCGSCRQVMSELLSHDVPVYMFTLKGEELVKTVEELLPYSFDSDNLDK
ncbi:MAG TPA: cytidine deaminase [Firmicutes bacterium]|nr:cytidine deaminase [Bacillota bacterium]